jgi:hypothetical protein
MRSRQVCASMPTKALALLRAGLQLLRVRGLTILELRQYHETPACLNDASLGDAFSACCAP